MAVKTTINFNGKSFDSFEEMAEELKKDGSVLVWDYIDQMNLINGKVLYDGTTKGRCHYQGKTFEGVIIKKDGKLYVGGEYVKDEKN